MLFFAAYGRGFAMAGKDDGVVGKLQQVRFDRGENTRSIAAGEIGAADGITKQSVAGDQFLFLRNPEAETTLRVAWSEQHLEIYAAKLEDRAVRSQDIDFHLGRGGNAEPAGLEVEHVELGAIAFVHIDRRARQRAQLRRPGHVIDVAVSNDDGLRLELMAVENGRDLGNIVAGIDNNRFMRFLVAEDRAITVQGADREYNMQHGGISMVPAC